MYLILPDNFDKCILTITMKPGGLLVAVVVAAWFEGFSRQVCTVLLRRLKKRALTVGGNFT